MVVDADNPEEQNARRELSMHKHTRATNADVKRLACFGVVGYAGAGILLHIAQPNLIPEQEPHKCCAVFTEVNFETAAIAV